jgi:hypothetical protein
LYPAENLPLQYRHEREQRQKYEKERDDVKQTRRNLDNPAGAGRQPRKQPLLYTNKDLINRFAHVGMKKTVN